MRKIRPPSDLRGSLEAARGVPHATLSIRRSLHFLSLSICVGMENLQDGSPTAPSAFHPKLCGVIGTRIILLELMPGCSRVSVSRQAGCFGRNADGNLAHSWTVESAVTLLKCADRCSNAKCFCTEGISKDEDSCAHRLPILVFFLVSYSFGGRNIRGNNHTIISSTYECCHPLPGEVYVHVCYLRLFVFYSTT